MGSIGVGPRGVSPGRPLLTAAEEAALVAPPAPLVRATKATPMHIRFKFGQLGGGKGQFNSPHGFCLGNDEDIIVADTNNHRITVYLLFNITLKGLICVEDSKCECKFTGF